MDGHFVNHGTQKGQTVMVLPLGTHSKCTYNPDTCLPTVPTVCRGNLQGEPNKVTNQEPVCGFI